MRNRDIGTSVFVTLALATTAACTSEPQLAGVEEPVSGSVRHGMWAEGVDGWLYSSTGRDAFVSYALDNGITNVYLSVGNILPDDSNHTLATFLTRLYNNGIKADALLGGKVYADIDGALDKVYTFNGTMRTSGNFQGVHLDLEPWTVSGTTYSDWAGDLIATYQTVQASAADHDLPLVADGNGIILAGSDVPAQDVQDMVDATARLVLMIYEHPMESWVEGKYDAVSAKVTTTSTNGLLIGIRGVDFDPPFDTGADFDTAYFGTSKDPNYWGWAFYKYDY